MSVKDTPQQDDSDRADNATVNSPDPITIYYDDSEDIPLRLAPWQLRLVRCLAKRKLPNQGE